MSNVTFQTETFGNCILEAMPLLRKHWEEIALNKDSVPLDPDYSSYFKLDQVGMLHITTARCDGKLIGYSVYFLIPNLHYKSLQVAETDIFWLDPEHRKGSLGIRLIREAEKALIEKGINMIISKVKLHFDTGPVFNRLGYKAIEKIYAKKVG